MSQARATTASLRPLYVDAVVARGEVAAGQPLRAEALGTGEQDLAAIPDLLLSPDQAAGYRARRTLRAGQPLRRSLLRGGSAVAHGQPLRIVATGQGFQIAIAGTALEDGGVGDSVRIRNTSTGKTTRARVLAPGVVGLEAEAAPWRGAGRRGQAWRLKQKAPRMRGFCVAGNGGYGWTRTTDPSIMSAVL